MQNDASCSDSLELPSNDGTDACTFFFFASAYHMWEAKRRGVFQLSDWKATVPPMFQKLVPTDLKEINQVKETRRYDTLECKEVLKKGGFIPSKTEIYERSPESATVFSPRGRQLVKEVLQVEQDETRFWIYTCEPYSFLIGVVGGDYFILDTHPESDEKEGKKAGLLKVFQGNSVRSRQAVP